MQIFSKVVKVCYEVGMAESVHTYVLLCKHSKDATLYILL